MCGRFALDIDKNAFTRYYRNPQMEIELSPHYNIAPGSYIPAVYLNQTGNEIVTPMRWGLVPHWSQEPKTKFSTINARAETIQTSAVYRDPFRSKRCLIPATGFYEWRLMEDSSKQPYYIHLKDQSLFSFAGLYDIWKDIEGKELWTCTIITTTPNKLMEKIHNRMPVILNSGSQLLWMQESDLVKVQNILVPLPEKEMEAYPISKLINNPQNDDDKIIRPSN
jgi:putative SOS response-associated peptidase YedK